MPYTQTQPIHPCTVCGANANLLGAEFGQATIVNCSRCGDFEVERGAIIYFGLPLRNPYRLALASHLIRRMQDPSGPRPFLSSGFFSSLANRRLPTPAEASDNLIMWLAQEADGSPGKSIAVHEGDPKLLASVGVIAPEDIRWILGSLHSRHLVRFDFTATLPLGNLTAEGWQRFEDLKRARIASKFAFFARKFENADLDHVFEACLRPAVAATGYELRVATQRAGLVDAIIEDEIRRCRFLIADLSDDNAGAYWEAGLAEGLGKDVIYICRASEGSEEKRTHFDTNHRHTVRWDLETLDQTARKLKAVIRNTLLGNAIQSD